MTGDPLDDVFPLDDCDEDLGYAFQQGGDASMNMLRRARNGESIGINHTWLLPAEVIARFRVGPRAPEGLGLLKPDGSWY